MGNYVSNNAVYLSAKRVLRRYNIESRAFKEIEKQSKTPVAAPKHDAGIIDYHKSLKDNKEYLGRANVLDEHLDSRLKDVYVTSKGLTENIKSTRPLPVQKFSESFSVGYKESEHVPPGKVSLLQAIDFITKHQSNSTEWTIEKIAEENKIKLDVASDIVKHYRVFDVYMSRKIGSKDMNNIQSTLKFLGTKSSSANKSI